MWTVTRIDEADYGCEERMPGEPPTVLVTLQCDDGRMSQFECADSWLISMGIDEGDEWPEDTDAADAEQERAVNMSEWMANYYDALEELEDDC